METTDINQSILIVTGMHRSGTSLTTSLLQSAGVDVGQRLIGATHGNIKGHFENIDFVDFHHEVLQSQGINNSGWTIQDKIEVDEEYVAAAKEIVTKNALGSTWGWKDPRTTLFLDFWANLLPTANFILVFRSPWEVADSLYRRAMSFDEIFLAHPDFAIKVWMHYNKQILDFHQKFPDRCLLMSIYQITNQTSLFLDLIDKKFGIRLTSPASDIYDRSLLNTQFPNLHRPTLVGHYFPEALEIYRELLTREPWNSDVPDLALLDDTKATPYKIWAFHDWLSVRRLESQNKDLKNGLQQSQSELQNAQTELEHLKSQFHHSQTELEHLKVQLHHSQTELQQSQTQFQHTHTELQQFKDQFQHTHFELQQSKTDLQQLQVRLQETQAESEQTHQQLSQTQLEFLQSQSHLDESRSQLQQTQSQLNQTQFQLTQTQVELEQTRTELNQLYGQLQQTQSELKETQARAEQLHTELKDTQLQLQSVQAQLQNCQITVTAMETSKFWKLRRVWFQIRGALGVKGN